MQKVVKGGVLGFIGYGGIKNWIVLCYSLQDWFEIVVMYENRMTRVNGMKKVRWEGIAMCAIFMNNIFVGRVEVSIVRGWSLLSRKGNHDTSIWAISMMWRHAFMDFQIDPTLPWRICQVFPIWTWCGKNAFVWRSMWIVMIFDVVPSRLMESNTSYVVYNVRKVLFL